MDYLLSIDNSKLQQFVRTSWLCHKTGKITPQENKFRQLVVIPAVNVNIATVPESMQHIMCRLTTILKSTEPEDENIKQIKIAQASISGTLDNHPLIVGLALQCHRMCSKQLRGCFTMRGRRSLESDAERQAIADSGLQLALIGGNAAMAKEFGLSAASVKTKVEDLAKHNLPTAALAVMSPDILKTNFQLAGQRFMCPKGFPQSRWDSKGFGDSSANFSILF